MLLLFDVLNPPRPLQGGDPNNSHSPILPFTLQPKNHCAVVPLCRCAVEPLFIASYLHLDFLKLQFFFMQDMSFTFSCIFPCSHISILIIVS